VHQDYLNERSSSYMVNETGSHHALSRIEQSLLASVTDSGYAGVALNLIEGLIGKEPQVQIVNIPNQGSIIGMDRQDVVEIPVMVRHDQVQPMTVGYIPEHCLGLMREVKHYEQLTIEAAVEGSYQKAHMALAMHPLIRDYTLAGTILDDYITKHQGYFPILK
jgi:alpha-galactosidase/6-phospho-beta-glucosidase family protein